MKLYTYLDFHIIEIGWKEAQGRRKKRQDKKKQKKK